MLIFKYLFTDLIIFLEQNSTPGITGSKCWILHFNMYYQIYSLKVTLIYIAAIFGLCILRWILAKLFILKRVTRMMREPGSKFHVKREKNISLYTIMYFHLLTLSNISQGNKHASMW